MEMGPWLFAQVRRMGVSFFHVELFYIRVRCYIGSFVKVLDIYLQDGRNTTLLSTY